MFRKNLSSFILGLVIAASSVVLGQVPISGLPTANLPLTGSEKVVMTQVQNGKAVTVQAPASVTGPAQPYSTSIGGTGEAGTITGIPMANGASPFTQATSAQIASPFTGCSGSAPYLSWLGTCITAGGVSSISQGTGILATPNPITGTGSIAVDQSFSPTWTGNHTFTPAAGVGLSVNGQANSFAASLTGSNTAGQSKGLNILAGTNSSDTNLLLQNQSGSTTFGRIFGDGGFVLNNATGGDKGIGTINASQLYVNGVAVGTGSGSVSSISQGTGITLTPNPLTTTGTAALDTTANLTWTGHHSFTLSGSGGASTSTVDLSALVPYLALNQTGALANGRLWREYITGSDFKIDSATDNGATASTVLDATRGASSQALSAIALGNSTDQPAFGFNGVTTTLNMNGTTPTFNFGGSTINGGFAMLQQYRAGAGGTDLGFYHSRSGTINTNTILNASDETGAISFFGSDGTTTPVRTARIVSFVDGTPSAGTSYPGSLAFYTTPSGSTNIAQRMSINNQGNITLSASTSGDTLTVNDRGASGEAIVAPAGQNAYLKIAGNGNGLGVGDFVILQDPSNNARIFNRSNASMDFSTNSIQRLVISAGGLVTANNGIQATGSRPAQTSGTSQVEMGADSGGIAQLTWVDSAGAADAKIWDMYADSSSIFHARAVNDAVSSANDWMTVSRSGISINTVNFAGTLQNGGVSVCLSNGTHCPPAATVQIARWFGTCSGTGCVTGASSGVSGLTRLGTGSYQVNFSPVFSNGGCTASAFTGGVGNVVSVTAANSSASVTVQLPSTGAAVDGGFSIICIQ